MLVFILHFPLNKWLFSQGLLLFCILFTELIGEDPRGAYSTSSGSSWQAGAEINGQHKDDNQQYIRKEPN